MVGTFLTTYKKTSTCCKDPVCLVFQESGYSVSKIKKFMNIIGVGDASDDPLKILEMQFQDEVKNTPVMETKVELDIVKAQQW